MKSRQYRNIIATIKKQIPLVIILTGMQYTIDPIPRIQCESDPRMVTDNARLSEKLSRGETILCAEGFLFELQRRGYLKAGHFVPEVVLEHPEVVRQLHEEFAHAGSDIVQAFTYYAHRKKLKQVNREDELEKLNLTALKIAREVADKHGLLMAGNICNSTTYIPGDPTSEEESRAMFKEEVEWALKGEADFVMAETYESLGEALLAIEAVKKYGKGLQCTVSLVPNASYRTLDGYTYSDALKRLQDEGALVVGLNCSFGPATMLPLIMEVRKVIKGPLSCLPNPYRTDPEHPQIQALMLPNGERAFFDGLDHFYCTVDDMVEFAKKCQDIGIQFAGICCGNSPKHFRSFAETFGRKPPASRYSTDMSLHFAFGDKAHFNKQYTEVYRKIATPKDMKE